MCAVGVNDVSVWMWIHMLLVQAVSNACDRGDEYEALIAVRCVMTDEG